MDLPILIHRDLRSFVKDISQIHHNRVYNIDTGYDCTKGLFINVSKGESIHIFCPVLSIERNTLPYPLEGEIEEREKAWTDLAFRAESRIRQYVDSYYNQHDNAAPLRFSTARLHLDGAVWQSAIEIAGLVEESEL